MTTDPTRSSQLTSTSTRVHRNGLADDKAIGKELADSLAGVGIGDFARFAGVEPDLAFATACNRGGQALLSGEIDPGRWVSDGVFIVVLIVMGNCSVGRFVVFVEVKGN